MHYSFLSQYVNGTKIDRVEPKLLGFTCVTLILGYSAYIERVIKIHPLCDVMSSITIP